MGLDKLMLTSQEVGRLTLECERLRLRWKGGRLRWKYGWSDFREPRSRAARLCEGEHDVERTDCQQRGAGGHKDRVRASRQPDGSGSAADNGPGRATGQLAGRVSDRIAQSRLPGDSFRQSRLRPLDTRQRRAATGFTRS